MAKRSNRISEYFNCHVQFWSERHQEWRYWHNQGERAWDKKDLEQWGKKIQYNFQHLLIDQSFVLYLRDGREQGNLSLIT